MTAQIQPLRPAPDTLVLRLSGDWTRENRPPAHEGLRAELEKGSKLSRIEFESDGLTGWDSSLLVFLLAIHEACGEQNIQVDPRGLPEGVARLLDLATSVPKGGGDRGGEKEANALEQIGVGTLKAADSVKEFITFVGEAFLSFLRFLVGRAQFRKRDLLLFIEQNGPGALPIVTLISFLIGTILAFVGAMQLREFGAEVYVANLVGLGMTVEMGAMMTAIIMAGRTGAAYAAELGTMTVNEEIDALRTSGINPMDFLVLPRMLALIITMPLLVLYADFIGILGGSLVASFLDISFTQYIEQTKGGLLPKHFMMGLVKAGVYGVVVALAGCMKGIQSGRSAAAVGAAVTSAVVLGIVMVIVSSAILTVIYNVLGI